MMIEFEMRDLSTMHYFLRIEVVQSANEIFISQKKYVRKLLDSFQMKDWNPLITPAEYVLKLNKNHGENKINNTFYKPIVGSLLYLIATRLDTMHFVSLIIKNMENPIVLHLLDA